MAQLVERAAVDFDSHAKAYADDAMSADIALDSEQIITGIMWRSYVRRNRKRIERTRFGY